MKRSFAQKVVYLQDSDSSIPLNDPANDGANDAVNKRYKKFHKEGINPHAL
ncbi:hypothetical protein [Paenibacillus sp. FSL R5-0923]|uniref:hypothetical protein n=1 Tax=Paenibacillus sp. FSL R5-0923 TaxID=2921666 RepID=UPI0030FA6047